MASPWENKNQYLSTSGKTPPKFTALDDLKKVYGEPNKLVPGMEYQFQNSSGLQWGKKLKPVDK